MRKEVIIENDDVSLYCYPEIGVVHHVLHKFCYGDTFRNLMTKGADTFIKYKCTKWLSNDKSNSALRQEDIEWGQKNWEGRIIKNWKYWALIVPNKVVGQMSMKPIIQRYAGMGVQVQLFENEKDALDWLASVK